MAVIGAGAIGGFLAGVLGAQGHRLTLLARGAHAAAIARDGLTLEAAGGATVTTRPAVIPDLVALPPCDIAFLTVKAHQLPTLAGALGAVLGRIGSLVQIQNGIPWWFYGGAALRSADPDGSVGRVLGDRGVVAGLAFKSAHVAMPGVIGHIPSPTDQFVFGGVNGAGLAEAEAAAGLLRAAGLAAVVTPDMRGQVWTKLLGNVAVNPLSALGRCTIGGLLDHPPSRALMRALMEECVAIAARLGIVPGGSIDERLRRIEAMRGAKPSMLQDFEAGRPMEVGAIVGAPAELARITGVPAPSLHAVHAMISLLARGRPD